MQLPPIALPKSRSHSANVPAPYHRRAAGGAISAVATSDRVKRAETHGVQAFNSLPQPEPDWQKEPNDRATTCDRRLRQRSSSSSSLIFLLGPIYNVARAI